MNALCRHPVDQEQAHPVDAAADVRRVEGVRDGGIGDGVQPVAEGAVVAALVEITENQGLDIGRAGTEVVGGRANARDLSRVIRPPS